MKYEIPNHFGTIFEGPAVAGFDDQMVIQEIHAKLGMSGDRDLGFYLSEIKSKYSVCAFGTVQGREFLRTDDAEPRNT
jgi:hypothetical protein